MRALLHGMLLLARWAWVPALLLAVSSTLLHLGIEQVAGWTGDGEAHLLILRVGRWTGVDPLHLRLALGVPQVAGWVWLGRRVRATPRSRVTGLHRRAPRLRAALDGVLSTLALGVVILLVLQPTLVPLTALSRTAWTERAANLVDGRAADQIIQAAAALVVRARGGPPVRSFANDCAADEQMRRWDTLLRAATTDDEHYAQTRAFLWVESGGRQFAVSRTGCAGLMQFCVSTAQRRPFRSIFGRGRVTPCACAGPCTVPPSVARALESDPDAVRRHAGDFPCSLTDARFDAERAIAAGAAFTAELAEAFEGNLYLMYIGYNSGPAVARKLHGIVGSNATLADLRPHLGTVLTRWYGDAARGRASGLLDVHLPKLERAYRQAGGRRPSGLTRTNERPTAR